MDSPVDPSTVPEKTVLFPFVLQWVLGHKLGDHACVSLFIGLLAWLEPISHSHFCHIIINLDKWSLSPSTLLKTVLSITDFCNIHINF